MLDLNFVRENLPLVEEKLRARGLDPAAMLKDFHQVDAQRRQAITSAETIKAHRNQKTEEIAKLKKSGQDASALIAETKDLREEIQGLEKAAEEYDTRLRGDPHQAPKHAALERAGWQQAPMTTSKSAAGARLRSSTLHRNRIGNWESNSAFWIWSVRSNSPEHVLPSIGTLAHAWNAPWPISCWTCTPASMATPRSCRRIW